MRLFSHFFCLYFLPNFASSNADVVVALSARVRAFYDETRARRGAAYSEAAVPRASFDGAI